MWGGRMKSKKEQVCSKGKKGQSKSRSHCRECGNIIKTGSTFCEACKAAINAKSSAELDSQPSPPAPAPKLVGEKVLAFNEPHEVERKHVTILIAEIADYGSLSEKLNPEQQYHVVGHCLSLLQEQVLQSMERYQAKGLVLDISLVETLDSFFARTIAETAAMVSLMGGQTVIAGMRPAVAITATQFGLTLGRALTALDVDRALDILDKSNSRGNGHEK